MKFNVILCFNHIKENTMIKFQEMKKKLTVHILANYSLETIKAGIKPFIQKSIDNWKKGEFIPKGIRKNRPSPYGLKDMDITNDNGIPKKETDK